MTSLCNQFIWYLWYFVLIYSVFLKFVICLCLFRGEFTRAMNFPLFFMIKILRSSREDFDQTKRSRNLQIDLIAQNNLTCRDLPVDILCWRCHKRVLKETVRIVTSLKKIKISCEVENVIKKWKRVWSPYKNRNRKSNHWSIKDKSRSCETG